MYVAIKYIFIEYNNWEINRIIYDSITNNNIFVFDCVTIYYILFIITNKFAVL